MVLFTWVILVGWLELGQLHQGCLRSMTVAGGLGCTGTALADWLEHLDYFPTMVIRQRGKKKMALSNSPNPREFQQFSTHLTDALGLINVFSSCIVQVLFKLLFFSLCPRVGKSVHGPLSIIFPYCRSPGWGWSSHGYCVSLFPTRPSVVLLLFVVQKLFNQPSVLLQKEFLDMQVQIRVSVGGGKFTVFLCCHLGQLLSLLN